MSQESLKDCFVSVSVFAISFWRCRLGVSSSTWSIGLFEELEDELIVSGLDLALDIGFLSVFVEMTLDDC